MTKCSTFLARKEMQVKTKLRLYLTQVRRQSPREQRRTNVDVDVGKRKLLHPFGKGI
jgi:hypothetical protein